MLHICYDGMKLISIKWRRLCICILFLCFYSPLPSKGWTAFPYYIIAVGEPVGIVFLIILAVLVLVVPNVHTLHIVMAGIVS